MRGVLEIDSAGFRKYFANTLWMLSAKAINLTLTLVISVLLARHLGPGDFGLLQFALSLVGIFALMTTLGVDVVLTRELVRRPDDAGALLGTAATLRLGAVALMLVVLALTVTLADYDGPLQVTILLLGVAYVPQVVGVLEQFFEAHVLARMGSVAHVLGNVAALLIAATQVWTDGRFEYFALIWVAEASVFAVALAVAYRSMYRPARWTFQPALAKSMLRESWPLMISMALVSIYANTDKLMVRAYLGNDATGIYAAAGQLSDAWYIVPTVIVNSVFPAVVRAKETSLALYHRRLQSLYDVMVWLPAVVALPASFLAASAIELVYGTDYRAAGPVLVVQLWTGVLVFLGVASGRWFVLEGQTHGYLLRSLLGVSCNLLLNVLLIPVYGVVGAALATLVAQFVVVIVFDALTSTTRVSFWMKCRAIVPVHRLVRS